jgi:hypothetical protein
MTPVQKLVHLAMRLDDLAKDGIRVELLKARRLAFENELTIQARRVGCPGRQGRLENGSILSELNEASQGDAASIINTYNYDLAMAIVAVATETPTANRHIYARRLSRWEAKRNQWKVEQIAGWTEGSARSLAQKYFYQYNSIDGVAELTPTSAAEPVCAGWIARGQVPLAEAMGSPPPYHVGCPHAWRTIPGKVAKRECVELWLGS